MSIRSWVYVAVYQYQDTLHFVHRYVYAKNEAQAYKYGWQLLEAPEGAGSFQNDYVIEML